MAADGRRWPQMAADGRRWPQMAANRRKRLLSAPISWFTRDGLAVQPRPVGSLPMSQPRSRPIQHLARGVARVQRRRECGLRRRRECGLRVGIGAGARFRTAARVAPPRPTGRCWGHGRGDGDSTRCPDAPTVWRWLVCSGLPLGLYSPGHFGRLGLSPTGATPNNPSR